MILQLSDYGNILRDQDGNLVFDSVNYEDALNDAITRFDPSTIHCKTCGSSGDDIHAKLYLPTARSKILTFENGRVTPVHTAYPVVKVYCRKCRKRYSQTLSTFLSIYRSRFTLVFVLSVLFDKVLGSMTNDQIREKYSICINTIYSWMKVFAAQMEELRTMLQAWTVSEEQNQQITGLREPSVALSKENRTVPIPETAEQHEVNNPHTVHDETTGAHSEQAKASSLTEQEQSAESSSSADTITKPSIKRKWSGILAPVLTLLKTALASYSPGRLCIQFWEKTGKKRLLMYKESSMAHVYKVCIV